MNTYHPLESWNDESIEMMTEDKQHCFSSETLAYLRQLYDGNRRRFGFSGGTLSEFASWSASARPALRALLGVDAIRETMGSFEPYVSLRDPEDLGEYTRQYGILHAEPGLEVPFWFLKPRGAGPYPIGVFPHGHYREHGLDYAVGIAANQEMDEKIKAGDRDVAVQAVKHGFAAIAPATRGFLPACIPDLNGRHGGSNCRSHLIHCLLAGRTVIGERVWDLERLVDWAITQPDVDASTILMMGNSGGGVATLYAAACDPRISIAVASCSFCTFLGENGMIHHCDCNAVPGIMRFGEFHDVAGLIAPRSLLIVHGRTDPLFPVSEIERAVSRLRNLYDAAGAAERFRHEWGPEGHRFYRALMWPFVMNAGPRNARNNSVVRDLRR